MLFRSHRKCGCGPDRSQVAYLKAKSRKIADTHGVPVEVISMKDYAHCNGAAVLDLAHSLTGK